MYWARLRDKEEGDQREDFLQTKRRGAMSLLHLKVDLDLHMQQQNNFNMKYVNCCMTSLWTLLWKRLDWVGLGSQVQQRKPFMSRKHVLAHPRFAQRHEHWIIDDWKHMIFNDKTKISRFNSNGRSWCWIGDGICIRPQHVHQNVQHGDGSVMIWGCMMVFELGAWYKTECRMDRHMYKLIYTLWSIIHNYNLGSSRLVFQQDNDPKHTSKIVQEWLASQPFQLIQWHAQFIDLNPMEHLWALLKWRLNGFVIPPRSIQELWERVCSMCPNFNEHDCMALYESMLWWIDIVLKN